MRDGLACVVECDSTAVILQSDSFIDTVQEGYLQNRQNQSVPP